MGLLRHRKALRGTRHAAADGQAVHLLAVLDQRACAVLGQVSWQIEALHHIRGVTYRDDHSQVRAGNGHPVIAALRNLAIAIITLAGAGGVAAATRHYARNAARSLATLGLIPA